MRCGGTCVAGWHRHLRIRTPSCILKLPIMSSLFKAGKRLVDELKPMLASPDRNNAQVQSQNPYSSPQPYAANFTPTTHLSPVFHQPGTQASSPSSPYVQSPLYQSPSQQPQTPASGYFSPQQPQPQLNLQNQATQSSQCLPEAV